MEKLNARIALKTTAVVGSMYCAYAFCLLAFISLPSTLATGNLINIVSWVAQTFIQLVLLSVIMVGQNLQAKASEERMDRMLNLIEEQQKEELKELKDDKLILKNELKILRKRGSNLRA